LDLICPYSLSGSRNSFEIQRSNSRARVFIIMSHVTRDAHPTNQNHRRPSPNSFRSK
jgi:hypothetical protein